MKKLIFLFALLCAHGVNAQQTGFVKTAAPTYTNNTIAPLSLTTGGALRVFLMGGSVTASSDSTTGSRISVKARQDGAWSVAQSGTWNLTNISGTISLPTGASTEATLSALNGKIPSNLTVTSTRLLVDGSGVIQPVSGTVAVSTLGAGTNGIGGLVPITAGGLTTYHLVSANTTNATVIKASAGQVYGWYIYNSNAAARKVAFHNAASTPTAGASVYYALVIPAGSGANVEFTNGLAFSTGIAITTVTELTDAGNTAVGASDLIINIYYK